MYDGISNWKAFYLKCKRYAERHSWSMEECQDYICLCLTDRASEYFAILVERDSKIDYHDLVHKLEKRFGMKDLPETAMIAFNNIKWADSVLCLATNAYKRQSDEVMYDAAIMKICQGMLDKAAEQYAANARPSTIVEALDSAKWNKLNSQAIYGKPRKDNPVRAQAGYPPSRGYDDLSQFDRLEDMVAKV
jgi:hypothetical protein